MPRTAFAGWLAPKGRERSAVVMKPVAQSAIKTCFRASSWPERKIVALLGSCCLLLTPSLMQVNLGIDSVQREEEEQEEQQEQQQGPHRYGKGEWQCSVCL